MRLRRRAIWLSMLRSLLALGHNNREIGLKLVIQEKAVKFRLSNCFQKLKVRNRVEASLLANRGWNIRN